MIRGHNVMKGYYRDPEATARILRDGWLRTGDLARRDEDGYYYMIDRVADVIVQDGRTIYPHDIEEVLTTHPEVSLVAVCGEPAGDGPSGDGRTQITAYVIRAPGASTGAAELLRWCRARLPADASPQAVQFRDRFPMTAAGKILKRRLR